MPKEEINLLKPEQAQGSGFSFVKKSPVVLYVMIGLLVLEVSVWGWFFYQKRTLDKQNDAARIKITELDAEINRHEPGLKHAIGYQQRLKNIDTLLTGHIYWSPVFEELADYTHKAIRYNTFQGELTTQRILVSGIAPTFTDIAKLILGLKRSDKFIDILFQSEGPSSGEKTGFGFNLDLKIHPNLLKK